MDTTASRPKNPNRVSAGSINGPKRGPLSEDAIQRLREATLLHKPWLHSTGPRTAQGKQRSSANGRKLQKGAKSLSQLRAELGDVHALIAQMAELCKVSGHD